MYSPSDKSIDRGVLFLDWIGRNAKNIGLRVAIHREFKAIWPEVVAARATLDFRGHYVEGFGHGQSQEQAIIVSVAELIERCCLLASRDRIASSSGFAVHTDRIIAERNAVFELLERDAFLCHHLTQTPFQLLSTESWPIEMPPTMLRLLAVSEETGLKFTLGAMATCGTGFGHVIAINGSDFESKFGAIVACAYDSSSYRAIERCAREVMSVLSFRICAGLWGSMSLAEFESINDLGPEHHARYALYADKHDWFKNSFDKAALGKYADFSPKIKIAQLESPEEFAGSPIFACRASSDDLQNLFFGYPSLETVNITRLTHFAGRPVAIDEILAIPPHLLD